MEQTPLKKIETVDVHSSLAMDDTKKGILISLAIVLVAVMGIGYYLTHFLNKNNQAVTLSDEDRAFLLSQLPKPGPAVELTDKDKQALIKQLPKPQPVVTLSEADRADLLKQLGK